MNKKELIRTISRELDSPMSQDKIAFVPELKYLLDMCKKHTLELESIFPCNTKEEEHAFELLCRAYVEARYNDRFAVGKEVIDILVPRIELLIRTVEKVCSDRIAFYDSKSRDSRSPESETDRVSGRRQKRKTAPTACTVKIFAA